MHPLARQALDEDGLEAAAKAEVNGLLGLGPEALEYGECELPLVEARQNFAGESNQSEAGPVDAPPRSGLDKSLLL
jgi:hypothetical protein